MLIENLRGWFLEPEMAAAKDSTRTDQALAARTVLERKALLRKLFERFYLQCRDLDQRHFRGTSGKCLEIGSGSSKMKEMLPNVLGSDVLTLPWLDLVLRAEEMPVADGSLRAIYGINVFHHLSDPRRFFHEAIRVLVPGGGVVLIEPYHGPVARLLFPRLHSDERFDPREPEWRQSWPAGSQDVANQALSYIVFSRDRGKLLLEFPELELVGDYPHTHVWYLASGGVNFRQLVPDRLAGILEVAEHALSPLNRWISLLHTIVLRKVDGPSYGRN
jgi:SAM-dependent methyltransferase